MLILYVVCLLFYAIGRFVYLLFSSAVLRAKGAESIVYLTYIYRISIVYLSCLIADYPLLYCFLTVD